MLHFFNATLLALANCCIRRFWFYCAITSVRPCGPAQGFRKPLEANIFVQLVCYQRAFWAEITHVLPTTVLSMNARLNCGIWYFETSLRSRLRRFCSQSATASASNYVLLIVPQERYSRVWLTDYHVSSSLSGQQVCANVRPQLGRCPRPSCTGQWSEI